MHAKSTGPRTEEGKRRSSLNALRHGLTGQVSIMTPEERTAHDKFFLEYVACLKPETPVERDLAESAAEDAWRLKRAKAMETSILALGHPNMYRETPEIPEEHPELTTAVSQARAVAADPKTFQLISLYEQRLQRSMQKSLALLRQYQAERKAAYEAALAEAMALAGASYFKGLPYDPARDFPPGNGFEFSVEQINAAIERAQRVKEAVYYRFIDYRRTKDAKYTASSLKCLPAMPAAA